ncbi:ABC transporter substrate-binding protein [Anaerocolumna chitinilytica]|uniref:Extracellular solute-binding protein n=1 Tax=Anaerocolumna chitinilytica TaxID=1727145 RepID=A0A7I8DLU0_9FIRM|nr:hypothetical protein [Anaerocolumna chitinilytica]BCJ99330.1 hypothetical protein bsdcttw_23710 [Anaerocolumna chitinilytica]
MKKLKALVLVFLLLAVMVIPGCGKKYEKLDTGISGDISVMVWSGSGQYMEDIGHKDLTAADFTGQNEAAIYAMAKEFNKTYPNIKINVYAKVGDPNGNDKPWSQELEDFKAEHGKYPDIYASTDLAGDVARGMIADLSVFSDDPVYKSFNPSVMKMMNYYGFQAGLPQFIQPWGVYVNKELAEQNNIDVPPVDWNIDEYTAFATSGDNKKFWGAMDIPLSFINTGTKDINYSLFNYKGTGDHINLTSEAVTDLLSYVPTWVKSCIWAQNDVAAVPKEIMEANGNWGYNFFINNYCLSYDGDPWMMGAAADPTEGFWGTVKSSDWDIYPRPSTKYQENTIGIVLDPMALHNYAMDDGKPEWTDAEKNNLKVAYTFASFWAGSTDGMQARANQNFTDQGVEKTCLNDSFPLVTGDEFSKQMDIWYSTTTHQRYKDKDKMPGFQKVVELWEKGQFWDVSDKAYPYYITEDGTKKACNYEWSNYYNKDITGAFRVDANWLDQIKAKLPDWNTTINARFVESENQLKDGLKNYYGYTDDKFK